MIFEYLEIMYNSYLSTPFKNCKMNIRNSLKLIALLAFGITQSCNKAEKTEDMSNPFFSEYKTPFNLPPFERIRAGHYLPAFEKGIDEAREDLKKIIENKETPTFKNTVEALDRMGSLLNRVSDVFFAQAGANTNDTIQEVEIKISPLLSAFGDEVMLNPVIFEKISKVYENRAKYSLTDEQQFMLGNLYKSFLRNGARLDREGQDTLKKINQRLSVLTVKFSQNVLAETNNYRLVIDNEKDLAGLPETLIASAAEEAEAAGLKGRWVFTTKRPSIFPFLTYSENREKRKELFTAYIMRGNNGNEYDNNEILAEIIRLRAERAKLLGYRDHASLVLEKSMAGNPENVFTLLNNLWQKAIPVAVRERDEMQSLASSEGRRFKIEPWDWWYYAEKVRKNKYDLDDSELRPYFKLENVLKGAFDVAERLYGIRFKPLADVPLPHPEALAFEVVEADNSHTGILYFDFPPRASKQQGAWCGTYRSHHIEKNKEIKPVVTTVFNFTRPSGDTPALLSLEEVSTLFHEFGHALESLFNKAVYHETFVATDFVELPSQIMEHWAIEPEVLKLYAKHYASGEVIPDELVAKIRKSRLFNQGFETVEYLAASLLDMSFHTLEAPVAINIQEYERNYFKSVGLIPQIVSLHRSTYFLHITRGYDAGYYSYIWSAVLDNDAYEAFRSKGIFDRETALSFRRNILERNGTMDPMKMYVNFRGREPEIEPLLRNRGLI